MAKKKILVDIDFNQNQLLNPVLQNLPEDPSTGVEGQKYFNTTNHIERIYRNGAWQNATDEYELPAASTTTRGGIKVGHRLYIENTDVLNVHRASKVIEGIGRFATNAEVEAGTQPNVAIDPVQLKSVIDSLPTPMQFKGTLGSGGTITILPTASVDNAGFVYLVISDGTYDGQSAKAGDEFISNGTNWILVPSGDEPAQIQSDWNQTDPTALDYIKNKPDVSAIENDVNVLKKEVSSLEDCEFPGDWRTPTYDEWYYIFGARAASTVSGVDNARYILCKVNNINGVMILPDIFTLPSGITMSDINTSNAQFSSNSYTLEEWELLENSGCIFLPETGGRRWGTILDTVSWTGCYMTSTCHEMLGLLPRPYHIAFRNGQFKYDEYESAQYGYAVRLAKTDPNGSFSISSSTKCNIAKSNLQYHCLNKTWRFAENAYDSIGSGNTNIAENYNGYIDLFGFGTSGWNSGAVAYQPWSSSQTESDYITEDLTGDYKYADWGVYNFKKQLHNIAFSGSYNDLSDVPLGEENGIAQLDNNGKVPSSQLPSYVDDVIEGYLYNNHFYEDSAHTILSPSDQESGKIFVDLQDNLSYRWSGSTYVEISQSLALGETSSTAYRGDRGKVAYEHATDANRITTAQSSGLYKIAVTAEGHVASVTSVVASDIPLQDATETQKGVAELATSAEAITGTDAERIMTPKTVKDAHDSRHWFGTQAQFDALAPDYDPNVIYHVENTEDTGITLHWTDDVATLASNNQLVTGDMYAKLPTGDTDKRNITNLYMATSSSTYITLWNL